MVAVAIALAASAVFALGGVASSQETAADLEARMERLQAELDATTERIEELHARENTLETDIASAESHIARLEERQGKLRRIVAQRADELYRSGGTSTLEVLLSSEDFGDLQARAEALAQISMNDTSAFVEMARSKEELEALREQMLENENELATTSEDLQAEADRLQSQFDSAATEYDELQEQLARSAPAVASAAGQRPEVTAAPSTGGKACPVGQPNSFIDSWGYPRSGGRSHEGTDIMASYGTPVYAIVSGSITYAGYGDSAGNWLVLSGSDGNGYWYMHNQSNLVTGGSVAAGQQIATVGDTGNATGVPHVHFEYHPGGGGPVNPYPLVAAVC